MKEKFWSNCLFEAMKAKIKYGDEIKLIFLSPRYTYNLCPHWLWKDMRDGNVYDFNEDFPYQGNALWHKGYIQIRPEMVFERWKEYRLKTM